MLKESALREMEQRLKEMKIYCPGEDAAKEDCRQKSKEGCWYREVSAASFGVREGKEFDNTMALGAAIDYCRLHGVRRLTVPKGSYYFKQCDSYAFIMLSEMRDFILDGQGSEFIFESLHPYIGIYKSRGVAIRNLTLDWCWEGSPLASVGVVTRTAEDGSYVEYSFPEYDTVSPDMKFSIVGPFDAARYTPGFRGGIEFRPYQNPYVKKSQDTEADEKMEALVRELSGVFLKKQEKAGQNGIRFFCADPAFGKKHFHIGDCYRFRHYEYDIAAVIIVDSREVTMECLTIYSAPGSGFVGNGDISGLHFDHCRITVRPGTLRSISTTADCLHICNSQGNFVIENCEFGYAGDDCINIHDNASMGITVLDEYSLLAHRVDQNAILFEAGYPVELRNPDLSETGYVSRVLETEYFPESLTCRLRFEDRLPQHLEKETVLWNRRFQTQNYIIRNCRFTNNRARGILLQGCNGLIENNIFENLQGAAIQIETGCESRWSEGHGVKNLIIRNNMIRHCDLNAWQMAVLYMGVYLPGGRTQVPVFDNILIEKNSFIDCPRQAMFLSSCKNVSVRENAVINAGQIPLEKPAYGSSTMEAPLYGEAYHGIIQFEKAEDYEEINNRIISVLLPEKVI